MKRTSASINRQWQWPVLAVVLFAFWVLFPPYDWSFVGDDFVQFRYVWDYMERPFTAIALLNPYALTWYYRPLQNWWFLANRLIFGFNPFPYYAILATLHGLAICLVYRTSRQLRLSPLAAFCAAALFAIHAHWVDVVGWLSSMAIVLAAIFNLAAVSAYLAYLRKGQESEDRKLEAKNSFYSPAFNPNFRLGLTAIFFLLALITHEEAFLLPLILLVIRRLKLGDWRVQKVEAFFFITLFLLTAAYLYTQFTRPNLTLEADEIGLNGYLSHIQVSEVGRFLVDTLAHFTLAFNLLNLTGSYVTVITLLLINLLLLSYFYGGRTVKIGLTWTLLHLAFIYFALWTQKPELFAGRHIYQAGLGLVWSIGTAIGWWEKRWVAGKGRNADRKRRKEKQKSASPLSRSSTSLFRRSIPLLLLAIIYLYQLPIIHNTQRSWLERAERYRQAEIQVKQIAPTVDANTTVFAHRFPITPAFLPATFQVWYETTINTDVGGGLPQLQQAAQVTRDYYLFDYQDGAVVNLMPELQEHEETLFLWAQDGRLEQITPTGQPIPLPDANLDPIVAGLEHDLRVTIVPTSTKTAATWNSLIYPITIPTNSQLQFSFFAQDADAAFRVRLSADGSEWEMLVKTDASTPNQWTDITIPLRSYWQQTVILRLESTKDGIWGNPRLVVDP